MQQVEQEQQAVYDNDYADQELLDADSQAMGEQPGEGEESVYMIDGVVMRVIHIEGEADQYLMDPEGRIYDMQANFIGTANPQGMEELDNQKVAN